MLLMVQRRILPLALLLAGIAAVVYGARFHTVEVVVQEEREEEKDILVPAPFAAPGPDFAPQDGPPSDVPPGLMKQKVSVTVPAVTRLVAEPALNREVSIGGVVLLDTGELKQTYTGAPPSLCPT